MNWERLIFSSCIYSMGKRNSKRARSHFPISGSLSKRWQPPGQSEAGNPILGSHEDMQGSSHFSHCLPPSKVCRGRKLELGVSSGLELGYSMWEVGVSGDGLISRPNACPVILILIRLVFIICNPRYSWRELSVIYYTFKDKVSQILKSFLFLYR